MPNRVHDIELSELERNIQLLIYNLVDLKDSSGEFLLRLDDGRVIDTKGWNDWEWTHGIGLYGIHQYYQLHRRTALPADHQGLVPGSLPRRHADQERQHHGAVPHPGQSL